MRRRLEDESGRYGPGGEAPPAAAPCVSVIDDDVAVRESLARLLRASGFEVRAFPSPRDFLADERRLGPGCVVLDLWMPGLSGFDLQQAMAHAGNRIPLVFVTGHGDVPSSVRAMKAGAVDFLTKPVDGCELIAAVRRAIAKDRLARAERAERDSIERRLASLTPREHEVLARLVEGKLNKQIAAELGAAEKTIKVHRARVLQKMAARSLAELARLAERVRPRLAAS